MYESPGTLCQPKEREKCCCHWCVTQVTRDLMSLWCRQAQENCLGLSAQDGCGGCGHWHEGISVCRHLCHPAGGARGARSSQLGHTQQEVLDSFAGKMFFFAVFPNKKAMCEMQSWPSVLDVFLHMSFAVELSRELIPATCAELSGSCGCSSLLKLRLLSFMPLSAGPKY